MKNRNSFVSLEFVFIHVILHAIWNCSLTPNQLLWVKHWVSRAQIKVILLELNIGTWLIIRPKPSRSDLALLVWKIIWRIIWKITLKSCCCTKLKYDVRLIFFESSSSVFVFHWTHWQSFKYKMFKNVGNKRKWFLERLCSQCIWAQTVCGEYIQCVLSYTTIRFVSIHCIKNLKFKFFKWKSHQKCVFGVPFI